VADRGGLLSFNGRIPRSTLWAVHGCVGIVAGLTGLLVRLIFGDLLATGSPTPSVALGGFLYILTLVGCGWITAAAQAKRWHDRSRSGWMVLIGLIPVVGLVWSAVELFFLPGTKWANSYGPDPEADVRVGLPETGTASIEATSAGE
jgi:uncharacterized membrane protein YhaH (DUF805 family)